MTDDDTTTRRARIASLKGELRELERLEGPPIFRRSEIRNVRFFEEHRHEILEAARAGRIVDDLPRVDPETQAAAVAAAVAESRKRLADGQQAQQPEQAAAIDKAARIAAFMASMPKENR